MLLAIIRGRKNILMYNHIPSFVALIFVVLAIYYVTYTYVLDKTGERISAYQYREQSLQYQEDMRDALDNIAYSSCN